MKYFDETAAYWGDSFEKIVRAGNNRLSVRSVKIFADGKSPPPSPLGVTLNHARSRRSTVWRCGGEEYSLRHNRWIIR